MAVAMVTWLSADDGGRQSGPPSAPVYAATCVFPLGGESEVQPGWPGTADQLSVLLQETEAGSDGSRVCKVDFIARDAVRPFLHPGANMLILEGPKIVATAVVYEVCVP